MSQAYLIRSIGLHRGAPRLFLDDAILLRTAFQPGATFSVVAEGQAHLALRVGPSGDRKVSVKMRSGRAQPVIDINSRTVLSIFARSATVRVVVEGASLHILLPASEVNRLERIDRLLSRLVKRQPLRMGSMAHGAGIMSHAAHQGLKDAELDVDLVMANEIAADLLGHASANNDSWTPKTKALAAPIQEVVQDKWLLTKLGPVEALECGIPCSAASLAGRAKRGHHLAESHPSVGHLVVPVIMMIQHVQPVACVIECVVPYSSTASAELLRSMLKDMCYDVHEIQLKSKEHGSQEERIRWFLVAMTTGIQIDLSPLLCVTPVVPRPLSDVLDPISDDDVCWKPYDSLRAKQERDAAKGNCFRMQIVRQDENSVGTLRKGYIKSGSTDPLLQHPNDAELLRKFTAAEHARIKHVPQHLIEGLCETTAHQALGQSVSYTPVRRLFQLVGTALKGVSNKGLEDVIPAFRQHQHSLAVATG